MNIIDSARNELDEGWQFWKSRVDCMRTVFLLSTSWYVPFNNRNLSPTQVFRLILQRSPIILQSIRTSALVCIFPSLNFLRISYCIYRIHEWSGHKHRIHWTERCVRSFFFHTWWSQVCLWHCHGRVGAAIDIQIHPHLKVYATSQYHENDLITVEVQDPILYTWEFESAAVQDGYCYQVTEDPNTSDLTVKQYQGECPQSSPASLPDTSQAYGNLYTHIQCLLASVARLGSPWACWWMVEEKLLFTWILFWPMCFLVL